jgi:hypothetical protein
LKAVIKGNKDTRIFLEFHNSQAQRKINYYFVFAFLALVITEIRQIKGSKGERRTWAKGRGVGGSQGRRREGRVGGEGFWMALVAENKRSASEIDQKKKKSGMTRAAIAIIKESACKSKQKQRKSREKGKERKLRL